MGLAPMYSYAHGCNRMVFKLKKQKTNPLLSLALTVALALVVGFAGMLLPGSFREMVLNNILTPLYDTFFNLLGTSMGVALLVLGSQTDAVARGIEQINYIIQFLMEVISNLVPAFIFIVLVQMIWSDTLDVVLSRVFPAFLIAVTTASSVASFGTCVNSCEKKLGIRNNITSFGVPLGIVMFPPGTALSFIMICMHTAEVYGVECSLYDSFYAAGIARRGNCGCIGTEYII